MIRLIKHVIVFLVFLNICLAEESAKKPAFLRINKDAQGNYKSFDTLVSRYKKAEVEVDLIAVVHVGEPEYYQHFNQEFEKYDALLYELISEPGVDISAKQDDANKSIITVLQQTLQKVLGLQFQLDIIDYKKANFVHADMTPQDFASSMKKKNESVWSILLKLLMNSKEMSERNPQITPEIFMLQMLLSPDRKMAIRKIMATQFQDIDAFLEVFEGPEGSTIITERNKVAMNVLKEQIAKGKQKLAIFYGAGHMPDMERLLTKSMGFEKQSEDWIVAWNLS